MCIVLKKVVDIWINLCLTLLELEQQMHTFHSEMWITSLFIASSSYELKKGENGKKVQAWKLFYWGLEKRKIKSCHCCLHWTPQLKACVCESVCVPPFSLFRLHVALASKEILKFTTIRDQFRDTLLQIIFCVLCSHADLFLCYKAEDL